MFRQLSLKAQLAAPFHGKLVEKIIKMKVMPRKYLTLTLFSILVVLGGQIFSQTPKLPYKDFGACPFECCTYRQWTATKNLVLYKNISEKSPVAFRIKRGEKVRGITGVVITTVAGKAEVLKSQTLESSKVELKKGDTVFLLTYLGEGWYRMWYKGKFFEEDGYDDGIKILSQPKAVWWVKIKNRKGRIGWTKSSGDFDNQDQCGENVLRKKRRLFESHINEIITNPNF